MTAIEQARAALKPCPFCGGSALKAYRNVIHCENVNCGIDGPDIGDWGGPDEDAQAALLSAWNTRALSPSLEPGDLERLRQTKRPEIRAADMTLRQYRDFTEAVEHNATISRLLKALGVES